MSFRKSLLNPMLEKFGYKFERINRMQIVIDDYFTEPSISPTLHHSAISRLMENSYESNKDHILASLKEAVALKDYYLNIPFDPDSNNSSLPHWNNPSMGIMDAISLYYMVKSNNPRYYIECGSGYSTMFVAKAISDHNLRTKIISIDLCPRTEVDSLCSQLFRNTFESLDREFFKTISNQDIFVMDGSHRSFPNSDVTVFMTEILPELPSGLLYAIHDILLPHDYPHTWIVEQTRYYRENIMVAVFSGCVRHKAISPVELDL